MTERHSRPANIEDLMTGNLETTFPGCPKAALQQFTGAFEDFKSKVAGPLLLARNLEDEYAAVRPKAAQLCQRIDKLLADLIKVRAGIADDIESAATDRKGIMGRRRRPVLGPLADTFEGTQQMFSRQIRDIGAFLSLDPVMPPTFQKSLLELAEVEVDIKTCRASVILLVAQKIDVPARPAHANARKLTQLADAFTLRYVRNAGAFIREVLSIPQNSSLRHQYYSIKIQEFIGSGPKGIYEALLEERKLDAQRQ